MGKKLIWDETKRKANLVKHGLDFRDADEVLASRYRWDAEVIRGGEPGFCRFLMHWAFLRC